MASAEGGDISGTAGRGSPLMESGTGRERSGQDIAPGEEIGGGTILKGEAAGIGTGLDAQMGGGCTKRGAALNTGIGGGIILDGRAAGAEIGRRALESIAGDRRSQTDNGRERWDCRGDRDGGGANHKVLVDADNGRGAEWGFAFAKAEEETGEPVTNSDALDRGSNKHHGATGRRTHPVDRDQPLEQQHRQMTGHAPQAEAVAAQQ
mmetsp:Transcript_13676/g.30170  ORF Transcript_13676/g.30170 Transcript_13676/m.30170 type:complete len:207 (+) Transcript_13676:2723-3343(+)